MQEWYVFFKFYCSFVYTPINVCKYNLIKMWRLEHILKVCLMLAFAIVIYNVLLHRWYTRNNKFLTKIFVVIMPLYLTFVVIKIKIKLPSHFFPNSHGWALSVLKILRLLYWITGLWLTWSSEVWRRDTSPNFQTYPPLMSNPLFKMNNIDTASPLLVFLKKGVREIKKNYEKYVLTTYILLPTDQYSS